MANPEYRARLREPLASRVSEWQDSAGIEQRSDAVRVLMRTGLDAWEDGSDDRDVAALLERVSLALAIAGYVAFAGAFGLWGWFAWAPLPSLPPVWALFVLAGVYLVAAGLISRYARRRSA